MIEPARAIPTNGPRASMMALFGTVILALILWCLMFYLRVGDFWWLMAASAGGLAVIALWLGRDRAADLLRWKPSWILWGLGSALVLYVAFWLGDQLARMIFEFAPEQVGRIYGLRAGQSSWRIGLLLFFLIGPAEEIYWRGFLQRMLEARLPGALTGWLAAALIYGMVHVWALNFMLFMAALLCGLFWGLLFYWTRNLWPGMISHAVWDVMVFLLLPIAG